MIFREIAFCMHTHIHCIIVPTLNSHEVCEVPDHLADEELSKQAIEGFVVLVHKLNLELLCEDEWRIL